MGEDASVPVHGGLESHELTEQCGVPRDHREGSRWFEDRARRKEGKKTAREGGVGSEKVWWWRFFEDR